MKILMEACHDLMLAFTGAGVFAYYIGDGPRLSAFLALNTAALLTYTLARNREMRHGRRAAAAAPDSTDGR